MKLKNPSYIWRLGVLATMLLCSLSAQADPISIPEKSLTPEITFLISFSILLEAVCILFLLRRFQKPRFFIIWILGLHLITYPAFLGFLWLAQDMRPALAVASGESLVVLVEGFLIYLICRFVPTSKENLPRTSLVRCWLASLVGNACSLIAFPLLTNLYDFISRR
jgi:hypothetical protein